MGELNSEDTTQILEAFDRYGHRWRVGQDLDLGIQTFIVRLFDLGYRGDAGGRVAVEDQAIGDVLVVREVPLKLFPQSERSVELGLLDATGARCALSRGLRLAGRQGARGDWFRLSLLHDLLLGLDDALLLVFDLRKDLRLELV